MQMLTYKDIDRGELFLQLGGRGCYIYRFEDYGFNKVSYEEPIPDITCMNIDEVMSHCNSRFSKIQSNNRVKLVTLELEKKKNSGEFSACEYVKVNDYQLMELSGSYLKKGTDSYFFDHDPIIQNNLCPRYVDLGAPETKIENVLKPHMLYTPNSRVLDSSSYDIKVLIRPINDGKTNNGAVVSLSIRDRESTGYYISRIELAKLLWKTTSCELRGVDIIINKKSIYVHKSIKYLKEVLNESYDNDFREIKFVNFGDKYVGIEFFGIMDIFTTEALNYAKFLPSAMCEVIEGK